MEVGVSELARQLARDRARQFIKHAEQSVFAHSTILHGFLFEKYLPKLM
jgi:hypothetical protein